MKKLLVICGPTATGKTSLAVRLAEKFNGELVSADSRQVYKGMNIGTGKDHPQKIPIHLIDVADPNQNFNAAKYYCLAWQAIEDIWKKDRLPILVGGTGFYIQAVIEGLETMGIEPDWEARKKLQTFKLSKLQEMLKRLDPGRWKEMNESDRHNPRRLIRAIEVATAKISPNRQIPPRPPTLSPSNILMIGLTAPRKILDQWIDQRVKKRIKEGLLKEIEKLLDQGYTWENSVLGETIGYQEWEDFFKGEASQEEVVKRWQLAEHAYARRQITWFKRDEKINWFDISQKGWPERVEKLVKEWYDKE